MGLEFSPFDFNEGKLCLDIHSYVNAVVRVNFEIGIYFPGSSGCFEMSLGVGINGILGSGKVGMNLKLYLNLDIKTDLYFKFPSFQLSFYVLFKIKIQIKILKKSITFKFDTYIVREVLKALSKEIHKLSKKCLI